MIGHTNNGMIKRSPSYFKWSVVLIGIIAVVYITKTCNCGREKIKEVPVVKIDTVWQKQDSFISYVPKPYKVTVPYKVEIPITNDSIVLAAAIKDGIISSQADSLSILRDYLSTRYYDDSFKVEYGKVRIQDTVFANSIVGRGVSTTFNVPVITKTYTIESKPRNILYFGIGALGNEVSPLYGTNAKLLLKNRRDRIYEIGCTLLRGGELYYGVGIDIPIKLKSR